MQIQIGSSQYYLIITSMNIALAEMKTKQKGKEVGKECLYKIGNYRTIPQALHALADRQIRLSDAITILELKKDVEAVHNMIDDHFKKAGGTDGMG